MTSMQEDRSINVYESLYKHLFSSRLFGQNKVFLCILLVINDLLLIILFKFLIIIGFLVNLEKRLSVLQYLHGDYKINYLLY